MFNKETKYAIRGLVYIQYQNIQGKKPGAAEVAQKIEAPHFFIAKILQRLVKLGLISSIKGKGGGFYFEQNKASITLFEIISQLEGETSFTACGLGFRQCTNENPCPLHENYAPIRKSMHELVCSETIDSLASKFVYQTAGF